MGATKQKSYRKQIFLNIFGAVITGGTVVVHPYFCVASDGATAEREIHNGMVSSFLTQFEDRKSRHLYMDLDGRFRHLIGVLYSALNVLQFRR